MATQQPTTPASGNNTVARQQQAYVLGYVLSIVCTVVPYLAVTKGQLSRMGLLLCLVGFAGVQLLVQLFCFLHIGEEGRPRWRLTTLLFTVVVVAILVAGSLWIMNSLTYRMHTPMTSDQMDSHLLEEENIHPRH